MNSNVKSITTPTVVWLATAILHRENPQSDAFQAKEIFHKVKELDLLSVSDVTINMHITSHCVASTKASPDRHKKLTRVRSGWYRLFQEGDPVHETRVNGQQEPLPEMLPSQYQNIVDWYHNQHTAFLKPKNKGEYTTDVSKRNDLYLGKIDGNKIILPDKLLSDYNFSDGEQIILVGYPDGDITIRKPRN